jgi:hypothetical protein
MDSQFYFIRDFGIKNKNEGYQEGREFAASAVE